jgi:hypothetical protein
MPDPRQTAVPAPSITISEQAVDAAQPDPAITLAVREAARRVLARDGRDLVLQPWQAAWLMATSEGRHANVPPGCAIGAGWLARRLAEESEA